MTILLRSAHYRWLGGGGPRYPVFIVSKGRASQPLTIRSLELIEVPYRVIVEPEELEAYAAVVPRDRLCALPPHYKRDYDLCDDLGTAKGTGPGPARNYAWDLAAAAGAAWHWVMDDNIHRFYRLHQNTKIQVGDGAMFREMERFCERYANIGMAGPSYEALRYRRNPCPYPFTIGTRIYSCNLIRTDLPYRWRARYNEDTDLSLRLLKASWATVQFNAFLQGKKATQLIKGGNTAEFYEREGTEPKSRMLVKLHPDVARMAWRFNRAHHYVDYSRWLHRMKLVRRKDWEEEAGGAWRLVDLRSRDGIQLASDH